MKGSDISKKLLVGITGYKDRHWRDKIKEIDKYGFSTVSLFLERFEKDQRKMLYDALLKSKIKKIPLVHIREDMEKDELVFLVKQYGSKYLTIHESGFKILKKWKGFYNKLYLEMNRDNFISKKVDVSRIGGFCIDLSHFKMEEIERTKEFDYILKRKNMHKYFVCNHVNGYSYKKNKDLHTVRGLKSFDYLRTLPKFLFGNIMGIEVDNSIKDQVKFKKCIVKLLS